MFIQGINGAGGQVNQAKVNTEGQVATRSIVATETEHSISEGDAFQAYTGVVTLTTDAKQSLLYIKNNDVNDIFITSTTIGTGVSAGGVDNSVLIESVANVVASDAIVTLGTDIMAYNANGGSAREFTGVIKKGPQAASVNGVPVSGVKADFTNGSSFQLGLIVPRGGSASIEVTPPSGNTSMGITVTLSFHIVEQV